MLVVADLAGIEARMAPWLANDTEKLANIDNKIDGYKVAASGIYHVEYDAVTKDQRQIGKVADLSLGYGGAENALAGMAKNYGVEIPPDEQTVIVYGWRGARPAFERWWALCEYSAMIALDQQGREVRMPIGRDFCSEIVFVRDARALRMHLPSGRAISYHNARLHLEPGATAPVAVYDKPEGYIETLDRKILSNNMTQGLARDVFGEILLDVERVLPVVHHVHDELLIEHPAAGAEQVLEHLLERMRQTPAWCPGLPLDAAGYVAEEWRKD